MDRNVFRSMFSVFVMGVVLVLAAGAGRVLADIVVYPEDGFTVLQNAVDAGGKVLLKALTRDGAPMSVKVPNNTHLFMGYYGNPVTLEGEVVGAYQSTVWGDTFSQKNVVWIKSGGVTIRNLVITAKYPRDGAIWMRGDGMDAGTHPNSGGAIVIENNIIFSEQYGIGGQRTGGWPLVIRGNRITVDGDSRTVENIGVKLYNTGYWVDAGGVKNDPWTWTPAATPVEISDNVVSVTNPALIGYVTDGIRVEGWTVVGYDLEAEWGDNGPISIVGNSVSVNAVLFKPAIGVAVSRTFSGTDNCRVQNNVLSGTCNIGILRSAYGGNNRITDNDLSGVQAVIPMVILGHDSVVSDNVFGPLAFPWGALILESAHVHPGACPMPLPTTNCVIMNNDYRKTGAAGWVDEGGGVPANG